MSAAGPLLFEYRKKNWNEVAGNTLRQQRKQALAFGKSGDEALVQCRAFFQQFVA
ncbi:MAG: hypothetical protein HOK53_01555 [Gammaproteobacteria bacterium]|nr:hypothetical protein [Gammaproteobacteria bacterium]